MNPVVLRYNAFTLDPAGGNPAGVVLDARGILEADMERIAAEVGYSVPFCPSPFAPPLRFLN